MDTIKANPLPAAVAGFGLGWLLLSLRKQSSGGGNGVAVRYDIDNARRYDIDNMNNMNSGGVGGVGGGYYSDDRLASGSTSEQRGLRDRVGETASNLKDRASDLKHRAEDVKDRVEDRLERVGDRIEDKAERIGDVIKANPLPLVATGLGLSWMLYNALRGTGSPTPVRDYDRDLALNRGESYTDAGYRGDAGLENRGGVREGLSQVGNRVGETASNLKDRASDLKHRAEDVKDRVEDRLERVGDRIEDKAERFGHALTANPVPLALASASLGWLLYSALRSSSSSATVRTDYDRDMSLNRGEIREGLNEAEHGVREGLSQVGEGVGQAASAVKDKAVDAAGAVKDTAVNAAGAVKDTAASAAGAVKNTAVAAKDKTVDVAVAAKEKAGDALSGLSTFIHEQPIAAAAVALGTGLLAGLLLPATRKEHELLGPTRDRLMDQAQDKARELLDKAQNVASEAADTARQSARTHLGEAIVDSLTGASSTKDSIKDTAGKIKDEIKDAVRDAAQHQGLVSSP